MELTGARHVMTTPDQDRLGFAVDRCFYDYFRVSFFFYGSCNILGLIPKI